MFLDEELEKVYNDSKNEPIIESTKKIIATCWKRIGNPHEIGGKAFLCNIKRVELSYRLFAKRHPEEYREDGLKELMLEKGGKELRELLKNW